MLGVKTIGVPWIKTMFGVWGDKIWGALRQKSLGTTGLQTCPSPLSVPLLCRVGVHGAEVDLPLVLQLQVSVAEDPHEDAGAHVVHPGLCGAHGDLDLMAGLLVGMLPDVGCNTDRLQFRHLPDASNPKQLDLMSLSKFHCTSHLYLDMHGINIISKIICQYINSNTTNA